MVNQHYLTRDDLLTLLTPVVRGDLNVIAADARPSGPLLTWIGLAGAAILVATLNVPVLWRLASQNAPTPALSPVLAAASTTLASIAPEEAPEETPAPLDNQLSISDLHLAAPIIWNSEYKSKTILANLRAGVVHLAGTALPGQNGTTIITGHSSYYRWAAGDYKDVFAPLLSAAIGQEVKLTYRGLTYAYQIKEIYEVTPDRTDLLVSGDSALLRLITCTPLGSNTRRLIVDAVQTSPDPNTNQNFSGPRLTATTILKTR